MAVVVGDVVGILLTLLAGPSSGTVRPGSTVTISGEIGAPRATWQCDTADPIKVSVDVLNEFERTQTITLPGPVTKVVGCKKIGKNKVSLVQGADYWRPVEGGIYALFKAPKGWVMPGEKKAKRPLKKK